MFCLCKQLFRAQHVWFSSLDNTLLKSRILLPVRENLSISLTVSDKLTLVC